jgi:hypothetical protein
MLAALPLSPLRRGSAMPQQGHGLCDADGKTVREGRAQFASRGGGEGAVVPQLSLPPASGLELALLDPEHLGDPGHGRMRLPWTMPSQRSARRSNGDLSRMS